MASGSPARSGWLFGPVPDLFLGCGLGYAAVFALLAGAGPGMREIAPIGLLPLLALVTGTPHYGATLLRVYERREDRRAYALFSVYATAAVWLAFAAGLVHHGFGSWMFTLYLTWSPWHYTGQNYGIAVMFLRRRGIRVTPAAKRHLYASFVLCFALTFLAVHGAGPGGSYAPVQYDSAAYRLIPLGIPAEWANTLLLCALIGYVYALVIAGGLLLREASPRELLPTAVLAASQALWFAVPVMARAANAFQGVLPLSTLHADYAFLWVAFAHSVQYLWVTTYYARTSGASRGRAVYLTKTLLAGAAIWGVPALLFAPGALGSVPYDAGLLLLVASAVNLHHFILDGAIWKLRDGRIARILIRSAEERSAPDAQPTGPGPRLRWRPAVVWATGAICVVVSVVGTLELELGVRRAAEARDAERVAEAARRLSWIGRANPEAHLRLGLMEAREGDTEAAVEQIEKSIELFPTLDAWLALGQVRELAGRDEEAARAYEEASRRARGEPQALYRLGRAWLRLGERDRARELLSRAVSLAPDDTDLRRALGRAMRPGPDGGAPDDRIARPRLELGRAPGAGY